MFKKDKMIKKLGETKLFMDAAVNTDVPIEDIFDALDTHKKELNKEFIKGWACGVGGVIAGNIIGGIILKRFL